MNHNLYDTLTVIPLSQDFLIRHLKACLMEQVMETTLGEAKALPDKFRIAGDSLGERSQKLKQRQKEP